MDFSPTEEQRLLVATIRAFVDDELRPLSELSLRCRLPAYIVPSPGALLTTGIRPDQLDQAPMSSLELLGQIGRALRA